MITTQLSFVHAQRAVAMHALAAYGCTPSEALGVAENPVVSLPQFCPNVTAARGTYRAIKGRGTLEYVVEIDVEEAGQNAARGVGFRPNEDWAVVFELLCSDLLCDDLVAGRRESLHIGEKPQIDVRLYRSGLGYVDSTPFVFRHAFDLDTLDLDEARTRAESTFLAEVVPTLPAPLYTPDLDGARTLKWSGAHRKTLRRTGELLAQIYGLKSGCLTASAEARFGRYYRPASLWTSHGEDERYAPWPEPASTVVKAIYAINPPSGFVLSKEDIVISSWSLEQRQTRIEFVVPEASAREKISARGEIDAILSAHQLGKLADYE